MHNIRTKQEARAFRAALYVEGAGDRAILQGWARAVSPQLERAVRETAVILGGRRPARARAHFAALRAELADARGLCILDRDTDASDASCASDANNFHNADDELEMFVWGRRHIESYLLAPDAIRRALRLPSLSARLRRLMAEHFPPDADEHAFAQLHAKRLLAPHGPLARELGRGLPLGRIARAMRPDEMHADVRALLARLAQMFALPAPRTGARGNPAHHSAVTGARGHAVEHDAAAGVRVARSLQNRAR